MQIHWLRLENFKGHRNIHIQALPEIAVLIGRNNAGKSSLLQAACISKYGFSEDTALPIGTPDDVVRQGERTAKVEIGLSKGKLEYHIDARKGIVGKKIPNELATDPLEDCVYFLSPLRAPERGYLFLGEAVEEDVHIRGERTALLFEQLVREKDPRATKIIEWLTQMGMEISGLRTAPIDGSGDGLRQLRTTANGIETNLMFAGTGVSSVLPIIVQGILCEAGDVLILEEPEAHLHRATLNALCGFFEDCAERGIQVILTTHQFDLLAAMKGAVETKRLRASSRILLVARETNSQTEIREFGFSQAEFQRMRHEIREELS
ncbi:MAG: AAA family ATPase [Thermoplasmatota archaeon]